MRPHVRQLGSYRPLIDVFLSAEPEMRAVLLDSSLENSLGRYSIIGLHPYLSLSQSDGTTSLNDRPSPLSFERAVKEQLARNRMENDIGLPLIGGCIGYLTYDYGRKSLGVASRHRKRIRMPEARFDFYDNFIIEDHEGETIYLVGNGRLQNARDSVASLARWIAGIPSSTASPIARKTHRAAFLANHTEESYKQAVDRLIEYIVEGEVYIANMTQQLRIRSKIGPLDAFRHMRTYNPSPFGAFLDYGGYQVISASPERFLHLRDGIVETRPIKGTRRRGNDAEEDEALREELRKSPKDKSELLMVVDLLRNDLNQVCEPGSVQVTDLFKIEEYATVFHLVSTITGSLPSSHDAVDLIAAAFPGGSITGTPKMRAMEIIDELERDARGLYTGAIGYLGFDGSCDLNIAIRTAICQDGVYHLGVGGGITCESERDFEYDETLQKAKAILEALYDGND